MMTTDQILNVIGILTGINVLVSGFAAAVGFRNAVAIARMQGMVEGHVAQDKNTHERFEAHMVDRGMHRTGAH